MKGTQNICFFAQVNKVFLSTFLMKGIQNHLCSKHIDTRYMMCVHCSWQGLIKTSMPMMMGGSMECFLRRSLKLELIKREPCCPLASNTSFSMCLIISFRELFQTLWFKYGLNFSVAMQKHLKPWVQI